MTLQILLYKKQLQRGGVVKLKKILLVVSLLLAVIIHAGCDGVSDGDDGSDASKMLLLGQSSEPMNSDYELNSDSNANNESRESIEYADLESGISIIDNSINVSSGQTVTWWVSDGVLTIDATVIDGDLYIINNEVNLTNAGKLMIHTIDFPSLRDIHGNLIIQGNDGIKCIFDSLEFATGDVAIRSNRGISTFDLSELRSVEGNVLLEKNIGTQTFDLSFLSTIGKDFNIINNATDKFVWLFFVPITPIAVEVIVDNLVAIHGSSTIDNTTPNTPANIGFPVLNKIGGDLNINGASNMINIGYATLREIDGSLSINCSKSMVNLGFAELCWIYGDLKINSQKSMTNIGFATPVPESPELKTVLKVYGDVGISSSNADNINIGFGNLEEIKGRLAINCVESMVNIDASVLTSMATDLLDAPDQNGDTAGAAINIKHTYSSRNKPVTIKFQSLATTDVVNGVSVNITNYCYRNIFYIKVCNYNSSVIFKDKTYK